MNSSTYSQYVSSDKLWRALGFNTKRAALTIALTLTLVPSLMAQDLTGKEVVVVRMGAPIKSGNKTIGEVHAGYAFDVGKVHGDWLWDPRKKGWINRSDAHRPKDAIDYLTRQIARQPSSRNYRNRALVRIVVGEYRKAMADYSEAVRVDPGPQCYFERGDWWEKLGEYDKAIADFTEAIRLSPTRVHATLYKHRAVAWCGKGEYDSAMQDCDKALRLTPSDKELHAMRTSYRNRKPYGQPGNLRKFYKGG